MTQPTTALGVPAPDLTPELALRLLEGARSGMFKESVAVSCGIPPDLLDMWITMGLSPSAVDPYRTFAKYYAAAEKGAQLPHIQAIHQAAATDYRAAVAWLCLRYPQEFGPKATKNRQAADLQPTAADAVAEEEMVRQLIAQRPPVLVRLLEEAGVSWPETPTPGRPPPAPGG